MGANLDCCSLREDREEPVGSRAPVPRRLAEGGSPRPSVRSSCPPSARAITAVSKGSLNEFYVPLGNLGVGASGSVSRVASKDANAVQCAVKTIGKRPTSPKICALQLFQNEVDILSELNHPHIVRLYETFEDSESYHLVMEICTGGELLEHIAKAGHFTEVQAAHAMENIISGVSYMHRQGICHRDLKPENFLCVSTDPIERNTIKIIDFGLSCHFKPGCMLSRTVGTSQYAAPEVIRGRYDELCDLWSCGVVMYILLSGRYPFNGATDELVMDSVCRGRYVFPSGMWGTVSEDAKALIRELLVPASIRLSAECALEHAWIRLKALEPQGAASPACLTSTIRQFQAASKLKKAALHIIADQMMNDAGVNSDLRRIVLELDINGDGLLSLPELRGALGRAGIDDQVPPGLKDLMSNADIAGVDEIDYTEFLSAASNREHYARDEMLLSAFRVFDIDGDGKISGDEFLAVVTDHARIEGYPSRQTFSEILKDLDTNDDGEIDFEEFKSMMASPSREALHAAPTSRCS